MTLKNIKKILVVCTGNSCRSIMAEGYIAKKLEELKKKDIAVASSGTSTIPGLKPTKEAIQVMKENGIDVAHYVSSSLNKMLIENADIILVMDTMHKQRILQLVPKTKDKIYLLRSFSSEKNKKSLSIEDPVGKPIEFYRKIFKIIKDSVDGFFEVILSWKK